MPKDAYQRVCEERDTLQRRYDELSAVLANERGAFREATLDAARKHTQERARWLADGQVIEKSIQQRDWQAEQQRERARQILTLLRRAFGLAEEITAAVQTAAQAVPAVDQEPPSRPPLCCTCYAYLNADGTCRNGHDQALPCGCAPLDDAGCCASCGALLPDGEPHEAGCAHADPAGRDLP